jgi:nucleolar protein 56
LEANTTKATIIISSFGILAFNEQNELIEKALFPKKPQQTAEKISEIEEGKVTPEILDLIKKLKKKGYKSLVFENAKLAKEVQRKTRLTTEVSRPSPAGENFRSHMEELAIETGFAETPEEFRLWTHNLAMETAKKKVRGAAEKRDLQVAQAIQALDDLDKTINLLMSHVREWYGIHFPELDRLLDKHETYARLITELGTRNQFTLHNLTKADIPETKAKQIALAAEKSMGAELTETDLQQIQALSQNITSLYQLRQTMESYLDETMEEVAPNTKAMIGSLLGARLIAISGGLTNLARRPASTIQVLGAEKALFRSLRSGTRPPKHGAIFQHTLLHDAKKWQRGKIARALAGKLAIAVRADAFGRRYIGDMLKQDLEKRIQEVREKYAEPPPIPTPPLRHEKPQHQWQPSKEKWRKHRRERRR